MPLPIHTRLTFGRGCSTEESFVACPRRGATLGLDSCARCADYEGTSLDEKGRASRIVCRFARTQSPGWLGSTRVGQCMKDPICVNDDLPTEALAELLVEKEIGGAPVVRRDGTLAGVVSKTDRTRNRRDWSQLATQAGGPAEQPLAATTAGDVMNPAVTFVRESASLDRAMDLMATSGLHRLPVLSDKDQVVGVISALGIVAWIAEHGRPLATAHSSLAAASKAPGIVERVLVPVDFSPCSLDALAHALELCESHFPEAEVDVLHVWEEPREPGDRGSSRQALTGSTIARPLYAHEQGMLDACLLANQRRWKLRARRIHEHGKPVPRILEVAARGCDLIVLGTRGRSDVARSYLGSVAEGVTRGASCPVLSVPKRRASA